MNPISGASTANGTRPTASRISVCRRSGRAPRPSTSTSQFLRGSAPRSGAGISDVPAGDLPKTPAEFARRAQELLPPAVHDYFATGAADEITLEANTAAWRNLALRQRSRRRDGAHHRNGDSRTRAPASFCLRPDSRGRHSRILAARRLTYAASPPPVVSTSSRAGPRSR